jgi:hypothetical protein
METEVLESIMSQLKVFEEWIKDCPKDLNRKKRRKYIIKKIQKETKTHGIMSPWLFIPEKNAEVLDAEVLVLDPTKDFLFYKALNGIGYFVSVVCIFENSRTTIEIREYNEAYAEAGKNPCNIVYTKIIPY